MQKQYLEIGKIVNTHGIHGEIKVQPWCDTAEFLAEFDVLYFADNTTLKINSSRVHKGNVIMNCDGINTIEKATALRDKVLYVNRDDVELPEDLVFIQDIIGLDVFDERLDRVIGKLDEIVPNPANDLYVIKDENKKTYLVPAVKHFLRGVDLDKGMITIASIDGLYGDED